MRTFEITESLGFLNYSLGLVNYSFCYKYLPLCQQFLSQLITDRPQVYGKVKKCQNLALGCLLTPKKVNLANN